MAESEEASLIRELPPIRRAREYRLHDVNGRRYLDLYQDAGRAVLGRRPPRVLTQMGNVLDRGLLGELPSVYEGKLYHALAALFPGMSRFGIYRSASSIASFLPWYDPLTDELCTEKPLRSDVPPPEVNESRRDAEAAATHRAARSVVLWRPFSGLGHECFDAIVPVLPLPGFPDLTVLCVRTDAGDPLPASDVLSPVLLAGLARAVWSLLHAEPPDADRIGEAFATALWRRCGMYLLPRYHSSRHPEVFRLFLKNGFLLPPRYRMPAVLPGEFSDGEAKSFVATAALVEAPGCERN